MITYKILIGDDVVFDVYLNIHDPLSTCEIYKGNQLVTFGNSLCNPMDDFSKTIGAEKALKSALNRLNYKTGEAFIHPRYHDRFLRWIPKVCHDNTVVDTTRVEHMHRNYINFLKTIYDLPYTDEA